MYMAAIAILAARAETMTVAIVPAWSWWSWRGRFRLHLRCHHCWNRHNCRHRRSHHFHLSHRNLSFAFASLYSTAYSHQWQGLHSHNNFPRYNHHLYQPSGIMLLLELHPYHHHLRDYILLATYQLFSYKCFTLQLRHSCRDSSNFQPSVHIYDWLSSSEGDWYHYKRFQWNVEGNRNLEMWVDTASKQ